MHYLKSNKHLMKRSLLIVIGIVLVTIFIFDRTPNKSFRPIGDNCDLRTYCGSVEQGDGVSLAFVEFDDQGQYYDQRQSFQALRLVRDAVNSGGSAVDVFVFVHGWHHNASVSDSNVKQFRDFLVLRRQYAAHKAVGVYIGWPGETLRFPLKYLTFWSRKAAAHRIASGSVQEFFASLQQIKLDQGRSDRTPSSVPKIVPKIFVIGHSFGGLVAFQANSQSFALRYGEAAFENRGGPSAPGLGDLVVLINPAIEAARFSSLHSLWSEYPNDPFYSPVMVTVASRTDWSTRFLFPLGVLSGTLITNQLRPGEWSDALHTVGNAESYLTHNAFVDARGSVVICERPQELSLRKAPFWFVSADSAIIDGHSDFNAKKLLALFDTIQRDVGAKTPGGLPSCASLGLPKFG